MNTSHMRPWWSAKKSYFAALGIFLTSRVVVALAIVFSSHFVQRVPGDIFTDLTPRWYRYLLRWDAGWYLKIVKEGYSYNGNDLVQQPVIFFPLYPLISKTVSISLGISEGAALLVVSNVSIVLAALLFFKLVKDEYGDEIAYYATAVLCFFPTSLFFSAGYTESLILLLIVIFFLLLKNERFVLASVVISLALATHPREIVLCLPLVLGVWLKRGRNPKQAIALAAGCLVLATSGLWLYMIYLWKAFNAPRAFRTNMKAWGEGVAPGRELFRAFTLQPFRRLIDVWKFGLDPNTLSPWFFVLFVLLIMFCRKRLQSTYLVYALAVLIFPYVMISGSLGFTSFTRYTLLAFPVFVIAGELFHKRTWLGLSVVAVLAAMLFMYTAFFAQWYFTG